MKWVLILPIVLLSLVSTPSYSGSLLCGTVGIGCEKVDWSEVVSRNGYVYKKFSNEKFTGEVIGQEQYKVVNGLIEGEFIRYMESGSLSSEGSYKNGKRTGRWTNYRKDGQISSFHNYQEGLSNGPFETYIHGYLLTKGSFKDGEKHGKWWIYDIDNVGVLKYERIYKNGKITWENGKLVSN